MSKTAFSQFGALIKWPQCVIIGEPVTIEQAKEILSRTDMFFQGYGSNQSMWDKSIWNEIGLPTYGYDGDKWQEYFEKHNRFKEKHKLLDLEYLSNDYISTCFIGGVHGWCHPDGTIHFWDNIGKWPTWKEIHSDCKMIAKAFPFLDIKVYLFNQEADCEKYYDYPKECVGGFKIKNGRVYCLKETEYLVPHVPECSAPYDGSKITCEMGDNSMENYINSQKKSIFGDKADLRIFKESCGELFFNEKEFKEYFSNFIQ